MFEQCIQLNHLPLGQLNRIIKAHLDETEIICLLYDASGELLLSFPDEKRLEVASPVAQTEEIAELCRRPALAALNSKPPHVHVDDHCLTEVIRHQKQIQGVLVGWIRQPNVEPQVISLWKRIIGITRDRIEDLLNSQEELDALSAELLDKYRELGLIHTLSNRLAGLADLKQVYHLVLEQVIKIVKADSGYIYRFNESHGELPMVQCYPHTADSSVLPSVQPGEGLIGEVAQGGEPILIEDTGHPRWDANAGLPFTPPLICCPLQIGNAALGAIIVERESSADVFNAGDLKILESAALQSAAAIMNISFLESLTLGVSFLKAY